MSGTIMRLRLTELKTVRVRCKGTVRNADGAAEPCPMTYEVDIKALRTSFSNNQCPRCNQHWGASNAPVHLLESLASALMGLTAATDRLEVEFDLPVKE